MVLNCPLPRRYSEMVGSIHPTHATQPLPWTPLIPHLQKGEMSPDLYWALLLVSHPGILARRVPKGEMGCQKAELAYLQGFLEAFRGKMAAD